MVRVTLPEDTLRRIREVGTEDDVRWVSIHDRSDEGVIQIIGESDPAGSQRLPGEGTPDGRSETVLSRLHRAAGPEPNGSLPYVIGKPGEFDESALDRDELRGADAVLVVPPAPDTPPELIVGGDRVDVRLIPAEDAVFERISGIVDTEFLADAAVAVVGLGTGGSTVALELAKCGVGNFHLFDPDYLEVDNVSRHACDLADVGRDKVTAMREKILGRNPGATVETHSIDVTVGRPTLRDAVESVDCVLACTDTAISRAIINEEAVAARTPVIFGGAYERGYGGNVIRYDPVEETPCYACIAGTPNPNDEAERNPDGSIDYSSAREPENAEFVAEPGLSVDVGFIALIQTRYALATLLRDTNAEVDDLPYDVSVWGNRPRDEFTKHFEHSWIDVDHADECGVCGPEGTAAQMREARSEGETRTEEVLKGVEEAEGLDIDFIGGAEED